MQSLLGTTVGTKSRVTLPARQKEAIEARLLQQRSSNYFGGLLMFWGTGLEAFAQKRQDEVLAFNKPDSSLVYVFAKYVILNQFLKLKSQFLHF